MLKRAAFVLRFRQRGQPRRFAPQMPLLQCVFDGQQQVVVVPRLVQVAIDAAVVDGLHDRRDLRIAGQQDAHRVRVERPCASRNSAPLMPGIRMSDTIRSTSVDARISRAASPLSAVRIA